MEHDIALVTSVCDEIYVLDFGRRICAGMAADVMSSPVVQAAYLGTEGAEIVEGVAVTADRQADEEQVES